MLRTTSKPWASGNPRSSKPISNLLLASSSRAFPIVGTCTRSNVWVEISPSASCKRRTSPGLSSNKRILILESRLSLSVGRKLDYGEPEILDHIDNSKELPQLHGFGYVAVRVIIIGAGNVVL